MIAKIQTKYVKTLVVKHATGTDDIIGLATAFPAVKHDHQTFTVSLLRGVVAVQNHVVTTIERPILLGI